MIALIYTHPPDYVAAAYAARAWQALGVRPVLAIDQSDPRHRMEGVEVLRTTFPRQGNLNGTRFIRAHLRLVQELADEDPYQIKADSDTMAFGLTWLEGKTAPAVGLWSPRHRGFFGLCYALRTESLPEMIAAADAMPDDDGAPEDVTVGELADDCGGASRYEILAPGVPLAAYNWSTTETPEQWKAKHEVICFHRARGKTQRDVGRKMREFSEVPSER